VVGGKHLTLAENVTLTSDRFGAKASALNFTRGFRTMQGGVYLVVSMVSR